MQFYDSAIPDSVNAGFIYSPNAPLTGVAISFTDVSTNTALNGECFFTWEWGDGTVNTNTKNATHTYYKVGNYTVTHTARGSLNHTTTQMVKTVSVNTSVVTPTTCNPSGGNIAGIINATAPSSDKWTGEYPNLQCAFPYTCFCGGNYPKYQCLPNGASMLISENHPDCCKFCGVNTAPPGAPPTVIDAPVFEVIDVVISPPTSYIGEYITVVAHVKNTGNLAGAATVTFYWDDGTVFDLPRTTGVINVNNTLATPPSGGFTIRGGDAKLCAVVY